MADSCREPSRDGHTGPGGAQQIKMRRRARAYAAKFHAETTRRGLVVEPTDGVLSEVFAGCVRPARVDEYDLIREEIATYGAVI